MFDLSRLCLCLLNFDQLHAWGVYRPERSVTNTANGRRHAEGCEFRFDFALADAVAGHAEIHGQTLAGESVVFAGLARRTP